MLVTEQLHSPDCRLPLPPLMLSHSISLLSTPSCSPMRLFKRREHIPLYGNGLWQIDAGVVHAYTLTDDGNVISLGFWGAGDSVGSPFACIHPYEVECLTDVKAHGFRPDECWNLNQLVLCHLHQAQELLRIRNGQVSQRLQQLLDWLADKFGYESEQGRLIQLYLTHQDIANTIGTTRVTITRLLKQFEQEGQLCWVRKHYILWCRTPGRLLHDMKCEKF